MALFTNTQKKAASSVFASMQPFLCPSDGMTHVLMINSFSKFVNQTFCCENKYTTQINEILTAMQSNGYQIIDVKFNSIPNQGLTGNTEGFHTLITYR